MNINPVTFKTDGYLFRIVNNDLQYFERDFAETGINGMGGLWKSAKKLFKKIRKPLIAGAAIYAGYKYTDGGKNLSKLIPSKRAIKNATNIYSKYMEFKGNSMQSKLTRYGGYDEAQNSSIYSPIDSSGLPVRNMDSPINTGFSTSLNPTTMMLIGGGALVLILALRR